MYTLAPTSWTQLHIPPQPGFPEDGLEDILRLRGRMSFLDRTASVRRTLRSTLARHLARPDGPLILNAIIKASRSSASQLQSRQTAIASRRNIEVASAHFDGSWRLTIEVGAEELHVAGSSKLLVAGAAHDVGDGVFAGGNTAGAFGAASFGRAAV